MKLGSFPEVACQTDQTSLLPIVTPALPEPDETIAFSHDVSDQEFSAALCDWLLRLIGKPSAVIASVHAGVAATVEKILFAHQFGQPIHLTTTRLPIRLAVSEPEKLGIDRALAALAANRIRAAGAPAIVVSLGTACTVNFISRDGTFQGGAILPGLSMASRALHKGTTSLPLVAPGSLPLPVDAVGQNTADAIAAGVFWGMVGGIEKLIAEQSRAFGTPPEIFLTGGDALLVSEMLEASGHHVRLLPHLVLSGIAIACEARP